MSSTNLTLTEARHRARLLSVNHYDFAIDVTGAKQGEETFPSTTVVTFEVKEEGSTFIDLIARSVSLVELDGEDITAAAVSTAQEGTKAGSYDSKKGIALNDLSVGQHELKVVAECEYNHNGQGLHVFTDPADNETYLYTQFETADAKRVFACFDQPNLKATYTISVTAPDEWEVISNAPQRRTSAPAGGGTVNVSEVDYPLSTYLIAICAGPYASVTHTWQGTLTHHPETPADQPHELEIPLAIYCRKSLFENLDAETIFTETKQGFDFYHANFGVAYPFGKYDQLFVPEFNAGAMENAGCVTFRDEYVFTSKVTKSRYERRCDTILHEMAHMWFGDLVTMQWWDDLWLNESFATWGAAISQAEATEYSNAWVTFANAEKSWAYQQDQLPSTHPISTDASDIETVEQNFDGITYAKGSSVLKQLQAYVGRENFFAGVRQHFANHAFSNATFDDLLGAFEKASGRDLSGWADQWLKTTGINTLSPQFTLADDGTYATFNVAQSGAAPGAGETRTHRTAVGLYSLDDSGAVVRTQRVELDVEGATTEVPELVGEPKADLVIVNDDDLTYCLIGLDEDSAAFVVDNIDKIEDPMARTLCWSASWEMTRSQQMKARDFIALIAKGAAYETEISVLDRILLQAVSALKTYADPEWAKAEGADILADALIAGAQTAAPGSDFQLAFVQALAKAPLNTVAVNVFEQILAGNAPCEGLQIDSDLKWWALTALIAHGTIQDPAAAVDELLEEDKTSFGQVAALRALAAVNTDESKARVWDEVTALPSTLGNLAMRHKLEGLTFTGSGDHLQRFNERFFEIARPIWDELSNDGAADILAGTYPRWDITEEGIARAKKFLADETLPSGLKRVVSERTAEVERALANQRFDAAQ